MPKAENNALAKQIVGSPRPQVGTQNVQGGPLAMVYFVLMHFMSLFIITVYKLYINCWILCVNKVCFRLSYETRINVNTASCPFLTSVRNSLSLLTFYIHKFMLKHLMYF